MTNVELCNAMGIKPKPEHTCLFDADLGADYGTIHVCDPGLVEMDGVCEHCSTHNWEYRETEIEYPKDDALLVALEFALWRHHKVARVIISVQDEFARAELLTRPCCKSADGRTYDEDSTIKDKDIQQAKLDALLAACKAVFCNHIPDAGKKEGER